MKKYFVLLIVLLSGLLISLVQAESLTPDRYIQADIEARRITVEGMERRLILLQNGADLDQQMQSAEQTNNDVTSAFSRYDTTGASHAAYGTQNDESITETLTAHPEWQQQFESLKARFDALSEQMDTILGGNQ